MSSLAGVTIGKLRRQITAQLDATYKKEGREGTAALDARLLVAHALGMDAGELAMVDEQRVDPDSETRAHDLALRRMQGEPVARILGHKEFWGLDFVLSPETLVPRPDTETVVSAALAAIDAAGRRETRLKILDLGTGCGAILLALLSELPNARGVGIDCEAGAIATARENADHMGLAGRADLVIGDWASEVDTVFDLVVSNPPYIESAAIEKLAVDVRLYDPHVALDGGEDGLDAYRVTIEELPRLLATDGRAFLELGVGQAEAVGGWASQNGWKPRFHRDLAGIDRVVELAR